MGIKKYMANQEKERYSLDVILMVRIFCNLIPSSLGGGGLIKPRSLRSALFSAGLFKSISDPKYSSISFFFFELPFAACGNSSPKYSSTFFLQFP